MFKSDDFAFLIISKTRTAVSYKLVSQFLNYNVIGSEFFTDCQYRVAIIPCDFPVFSTFSLFFYFLGIKITFTLQPKQRYTTGNPSNLQAQ